MHGGLCKTFHVVWSPCMQNLIALCLSAWAYVASPKSGGLVHPLGGGGGSTLKSCLCPILIATSNLVILYRAIWAHVGIPKLSTHGSSPWSRRRGWLVDHPESLPSSILVALRNLVAVPQCLLQPSRRRLMQLMKFSVLLVLKYWFFVSFVAVISFILFLLFAVVRFS